MSIIGDEGEFGNALKDDPESKCPSCNESENTPVVATEDHRQRSCLTRGADNWYAAMSAPN